MKRDVRFQGAVIRGDRILLIRNHEKATGRRYWLLPGGGLEAGESPEECVRREIREETHLEVTVERMLYDEPASSSVIYRRRRTYLCRCETGEPRPGEEPEPEASGFAICDVRWFDLSRPDSWGSDLDGDAITLPQLHAIRRAVGLAAEVPAEGTGEALRELTRSMSGGRSFNDVAELYEAARPGYPTELYDDLLALARLRSGGSVLDIGCGTGKSTAPIARRGYSVCALDPAPAMLVVCRRMLADLPNVRYVESSFEEWSPDRRFDLAISGTAFHWVDGSGPARLRAALLPRGAIGIFWHTFLNGHEPFYDRLDEIYRTCAPQLYREDLHVSQELADRAREEQMLAWQGFAEQRIIRYYQRPSYDGPAYLALLRTWSTHVGLGEEFFEAVGGAIEACGGRIEKPIRTTLFFARRAGDSMSDT
jgi:ADP-ribose pyrophosphatase YjhB (NUDIX family)/SAM-dependent methyltransferase